MKITGRLEAPAEVAGGARIELVPALLEYDRAKQELAGEPPAPLASARADREGAFTLEAPGPGCYRVTVRADGYVPVEHLLVPLIEDRELPPVRLTRSIPVTVRTLGPRGEALAGVRLVAEHMDLGWSGAAKPDWRPLPSFGKTGADGRLTFLRAADAWLAISPLDPRFLGAHLGLPKETSGAGAAETVFPLSANPPLRLTAVAPDGQPVAGALLQLEGRPVGIAGSDGRLEVSFADPRAARAMGTLTFRSPDGEWSGEVSWAQTRGGALRVALAPRREVAGQLTDAAGKPVAGGLVWAEPLGDERSGRVTALAAAGADGRFTLRWSPGTSLGLRAAAPGYLVSQSLSPGKPPWRIALASAVELAGRVVDSAGRPCPGARVTARAGDFWVAPRASATSGPDGSFRVPRVAAGERYRLDISAAGFAPVSTLVQVPAPGTGKPAAPVRIVLDAGRTLVGRVVDPAGQPVAGVAITVVSAEHGFPAEAWESLATAEGTAEARSDAGGAFKLPHLYPGSYHLAAHRPGLVTALRSAIDLPPASSPLDLGRIVVEPGAVLEGTVTDRRGAPVAHADVSLTPSPRGHPISFLSDRSLGPAVQVGGLGPRASTGPDGRFHLDDLPRGQLFDIRVWSSEHPEILVRDVAAPPAEPLRIELADGGRLTGRVVDGERQPVFGAEVSVFRDRRVEPFNSSLGLESTAVTDAQGRFSLAGLAAGPAVLEVKAEGYPSARRQGLAIAEGRETPPEEIVLEPGSSLSGVVRDGTGHPVPGAFVLAQPRIQSLAAVLAHTQSFDPATTQADDSGRYRLEGLEPGPYQVGAGSAEPATIDLQPGPNELDLTAKERKELPVAGRLLDTAGAPLPGADLSLTRESPSYRSYPASSLADGSFRFDAVEPGEYELRASARGYTSARSPVAVADLPVEGLELKLERARAMIRGRLSGLRPEEILAVRVTALLLDPGKQRMLGDSSGQAVALVDESGTYRLAELSPGVWNVTALTGSGRHASGQVTLAPGAPDAELDLDFESGATLSGRVAKDGRPVAGAQVIVASLPDGAKGMVQVQTASDGTFRVPGLAPGTYGLFAVDLVTFARASLEVELKGDQEIAVDLTSGEPDLVAPAPPAPP